MAELTSGSVLDVGCGTKPYQSLFNENVRYVCADLSKVSQADLIIEKNKIPAADCSFDAVTCFQVLEHVENPDMTLHEIKRCARSGGLICLSVPFIYQQHGSPGDYRRFTFNEIRGLLAEDCHIILLKSEGGFGTSVVTFIIHWKELMTSRTLFLRGAKVLAFPIYFGLIAILNLIALAFDRIDKTDDFHTNIFVIAKKL